MHKLLRTAALIAVASSFLPAQTTTTTAPTIAEIVAARVAHLTKLLTLTTAQASQATSYFTTEVTALTTLNSTLATAKTALTTAVEADSTPGITAAATTIGTVTMQEAQAEGTAQAQFYAILTTAQQTIYQEVLASGLDADASDCVGGIGPGGGGGHR